MHHDPPVTIVALLEFPLDTVPDGDSEALLVGVEVVDDAEALGADVAVELLEAVVDDAAATAVPAWVCSASNPSAATAAAPLTAMVVIRRRRKARARSRAAAVSGRSGCCIIEPHCGLGAGARASGTRSRPFGRGGEAVEQRARYR